MKIAFASDDGQTTSRHTGRAPYFVVLTIENGLIVNREQREKPCCDHGPNHTHEHGSGQGHGRGPAQASGTGLHMHPERHMSHDPAEAGEEGLHPRMARVVEDCEAVLARGIGAGFFDYLTTSGIRPIVTPIESIDEAAQAYIRGDMPVVRRTPPPAA